MEELLNKLTLENMACIFTIIAFFYAVWILRNDSKSRQKQNELKEQKLKLEKFKHSYSLRQQLLTDIEELSKLPVRNNAEYICLRLMPESTITFDTTQPHFKDGFIPKDNKMYYTLLDALKLKRCEVSILFPNCLSKYDNYLSDCSKIFTEICKDKKEQNLEILNNLEESIHKRYKLFRTACLKILQEDI